MARVPEAEIERLKREISIESLVRSSGVELEGNGTNLIGRCPFHDDKTPSLVVTPDKNLWHCMGACQAGGTVIDWVMRSEKVNFRAAVESLQQRSPLTPRSLAAPRQRWEKPPPLAARDAADGELLELVVQEYEASLRGSEEGLEYLRKRGIAEEAIATFRLGYSNRTLGFRLRSGGLRERMAKLGVVRDSGHELLVGSVVVPLFDEQGRVAQLYGRKVQQHHRPGTPLHLYLPGGHRGVFNREALVGSEEVILCEALIDALTFWSAGYRNVTSAYGVEGFTQEMIDALVAAKVRVVKLAFDRDEAGDRGAEKASERLSAVGIETHRVVFPRGMDANEYAKKVGPPDKSLGLVLRQATWMARGHRSVEEPERVDEATAELEAPVEHEETTPATSSADAAAAPPVEHSDAEFPSLAASSEGAVVEAEQEPSSPVPVSPLPAPSTIATTTPQPAVERPQVEQLGEDLYVVFASAKRKWRIRGAGKAGAAGELKVNALVSHEVLDGSFFVDTVDLYSARQRGVFTKQAAEELRASEPEIRRELGQIVLEVERQRDAEAEAKKCAAAEAAREMTEEEREEALTLLRDPQLLERILEDVARAGIVGEETNKLVSYLAATSRKLDEPLAVVIQSSSAAGKSSLMDAVLALMPDEERVQYSAMTGQSLFYMSGQNLKHKILAIVEEEGAERASYALKLLQSEGELTIASTGKDPVTGRLVTQTYRVEGPVMIFLTTTAIDVDEELLNRCLVLAVDEGREQTRAIHAKQRRGQTFEGRMEREERQRIRRVHKNAQRLLKPVMVVNPFAMELRFADHATRTRRDHMKYLTLINAVTMLHQHQRPLRTAMHRGKRIEYIEATREDIAVATRLAHSVLGRSLDELPPQTRRLAALIDAMVRTRCEREGVARHEVRFSRRAVRQAVGWSAEQLRVHLGRLVELEYVVVHRGRRGQTFEYELVYEGEGTDGERFVLGLGTGLDDAGTFSSLGGRGGGLPGPNRGQTGPKPVGTGATIPSAVRSKPAADAIANLNGSKNARLGTVPAGSPTHPPSTS